MFDIECVKVPMQLPLFGVNGLEGIGATWILKILNSRGHTAYAVGGCIRDLMMNKYLNANVFVHDIDICTSATPLEVKGIFESLGCKTIDTGLKHGTETVVIPFKVWDKICKTDSLRQLLDKAKEQKEAKFKTYEITTYRIDGEYSDGRHPDEVKFTRSIEEDLERRDFTINAMAYQHGSLVAIDSSYDDLKNKIIRCVGNPDDRLQEDPLRILRAFRFQAVLGFDIDETTHKQMISNLYKMGSVQKERIQAELIKAFSGKYIVKAIKNNIELLENIIIPIKDMIGCEQNNPNHNSDVWEHTLKVVDNLVKDSRTERLGADKYRLVMAGLFHDFGKPKTKSVGSDGYDHFKAHAHLSEQMTREILKDLKFSNNDIDSICLLVKYHDNHVVNKAATKRLIAKMGFEQFRTLAILQEADIDAQSDYNRQAKLAATVQGLIWADEIEKDNEAVKIQDLAVNGRDLMKLGYKAGPILGKVLGEMLELVINQEIKNEKDDLLKYAKERLLSENNI